jgi:hypothetical protein
LQALTQVELTKLDFTKQTDGDDRISLDEYRVMVAKYPNMIQDITEEQQSKKKRARGMSSLLQIPVLGSNVKVLFLGSGEGGKSTLCTFFSLIFTSSQTN